MAPATQEFVRKPWEGTKFIVITVILAFIFIFGYQFITGKSIVAPFTLIALIAVSISVVLMGIFKETPFHPDPKIRTSFWVLFSIMLVLIIVTLIFYKDLSSILNVQLAVRQISAMVGIP